MGAKWQENIFGIPCKPIKIVEYRIGRYLSRRGHVSSCLRSGSVQVTRLEAVDIRAAKELYSKLNSDHIY